MSSARVVVRKNAECLRRKGLIYRKDFVFIL
jgi:hypothetical protein